MVGIYGVVVQGQNPKVFDPKHLSKPQKERTQLSCAVWEGHRRCISQERKEIANMMRRARFGIFKKN